MILEQICTVCQYHVKSIVAVQTGTALPHTMASLYGRSMPLSKPFFVPFVAVESPSVSGRHGAMAAMAAMPPPKNTLP